MQIEQRTWPVEQACWEVTYANLIEWEHIARARAGKQACVHEHTHTRMPAVIFHRGSGMPCSPRIEVADRKGKDKEEDKWEGEGKKTVNMEGVKENDKTDR